MTLSIIIPTLNNTNGLNYLKNYFRNLKYRVEVIDNSKKNLGFAGGVNSAGLKEEVNTKWILVLNDDIEFDEVELVHKVHKVHKVLKESYPIERMIKFAEENKLDAVTPVLRNPGGRVENYGYIVLPSGKVKLVNKVIKSLKSIKSEEVDGITAACLLIKTKVFKKLRGFDESFFAYLEDVDFFLRFKKAGYKMGIAPIEVLHNHMVTSKTMGNFKARQDMINWWRLYFKHPDKFKFNLAFIIERLRNVSGFVKATAKNNK